MATNNESQKIYKSKEINISEQYALTVEEAAAYFRVGETKLRAMISNNPRAPYVLRIGTRTLIKRRMFEDYLDKIIDL